jgi:hypothetical protein
MKDFAKELEEKLVALLSKKAEEAEQLLFTNTLQQAMQIESPTLAALGPEQYMNRLKSYAFGPVGHNHTLFKLDSNSEFDGQPILYLPPFKREVQDQKLNIGFDGVAKTGTDGQEQYSRQKALYDQPS